MLTAYTNPTPCRPDPRPCMIMITSLLTAGKGAICNFPAEDGTPLLDAAPFASAAASILSTFLTEKPPAAHRRERGTVAGGSGGPHIKGSPWSEGAAEGDDAAAADDGCGAVQPAAGAAHAAAAGSDVCTDATGSADDEAPVDDRSVGWGMHASSLGSETG